MKLTEGLDQVTMRNRPPSYFDDNFVAPLARFKTQIQIIDLFFIKLVRFFLKNALAYSDSKSMLESSDFSMEDLSVLMTPMSTPGPTPGKLWTTLRQFFNTKTCKIDKAMDL
jgi:hypothetical protein